MEENSVGVLFVKQWPSQEAGFKQKNVAMNACIFVVLDTYLHTSG